MRYYNHLDLGVCRHILKLWRPLRLRAGCGQYVHCWDESLQTLIRFFSFVKTYLNGIRRLWSVISTNHMMMSVGICCTSGFPCWPTLCDPKCPKAQKLSNASILRTIHHKCVASFTFAFTKWTLIFLSIDTN